LKGKHDDLVDLKADQMDNLKVVQMDIKPKAVEMVVK
jgi:hypothetical protein